MIIIMEFGILKTD